MDVHDFARVHDYAHHWYKGGYYGRTSIRTTSIRTISHNVNSHNRPVRYVTIYRPWRKYTFLFFIHIFRINNTVS